MPLAKLQPLEDCCTSFKLTVESDVKSLMTLYDAESAKPGPSATWVQPLLRSSCVLLVADFENFIEGLFCAAFADLASRNVVADKYPKGFRHWLFRKEVHMRSIGADDVKDYIELSQRLFNPVRALTLDELSLEDLKEKFDNPTPVNINWMAGLFDVENYVDGITVRVMDQPTLAKSAIGELAERRNAIAHGDSTQQPKDADIKRLTKFCVLFANQITKDVNKWTQQCL